MRKILTELNEDQLKNLVREVVDESIIQHLSEPADSSIDESMSMTETCEFLNIKRTTIYKHIKTGKLKAYKVGQKTMFFRSELEDFIRQNPLKQ